MLPFNSICIPGRLPKLSNSGYCKPIHVCDKNLYEAGKIHSYAIQEGPNEYPENAVVGGRLFQTIILLASMLNF